jgi:hypothetical protein
MYAINDILSSWSTQILPITPLTRESFALTGAASYTFGTGGTWNSARPVKIEALGVVATNGARQAARRISVEEFTAVPDTTSTGLFAETWYADGGFPTVTVYLLPKPASGNAEVESYKPLAPFVNLSDTVNIMPGYTRALRWALAFELAPEFGRPVTQELASLAADAKTSITGLNQAILGRPNQVEPANPAIPPQPAA